MKPEISIIIPTLNEEKLLPLLLESIIKQTFKNYEIIISDAGSTDNTQQIAKKYNCVITRGGKPAKGRNEGAKIAQGEFLIFLDADVILPKQFLKNVHQEMQQEYIDLATCEFDPISRLNIDKILHKLANLSIHLSQQTNPHAPGFCIIITKRLFQRIKGFDETLTIAEDHDLVKRASTYRPLEILKSTKIKVSVRRLEKEGRLLLLTKYMKVELHRSFKGEINNELIDYKFSDFEKQENKAGFEKQLIIFDKKINKLNKIIQQKIKVNIIKGKNQITSNYNIQMQNVEEKRKKVKLSIQKIIKTLTRMLTK